MQNIHLIDSFFEFYHTDIKPLIEHDEYLDWLITLPEYYKRPTWNWISILLKATMLLHGIA